MHTKKNKKILVAGWFSFSGMGATAGDLLAKDVACEWIEQAGYSFDVAMDPPFTGGIEWRTADSKAYSHVLFVCGPFGNGWPLTDFLDRFRNCRLIGLNLTMLQDLNDWNPFDLLIERDSSKDSNPDISFISTYSKIPVVGLILSHKQKEYGERALQELANSIIHPFINSRELAVVEIDTCLDPNKTGLRTPAEIESLIARMDVVITTRLHGTVLALKNLVPVVPVDPINGGDKIAKQVSELNWPVLLFADSLTEKRLSDSFEYCLTEDAKNKAAACFQHAKKQLSNIRKEFIDQLIQYR